MTGGTHQARVVRRLRDGAYGHWVICTCREFDRPAWSQLHADQLAAQHNLTPGGCSVNTEQEAS